MLSHSPPRAAAIHRAVTPGLWGLSFKEVTKKSFPKYILQDTRRGEGKRGAGSAMGNSASAVALQLLPAPAPASTAAPSTGAEPRPVPGAGRAVPHMLSRRRGGSGAGGAAAGGPAPLGRARGGRRGREAAGPRRSGVRCMGLGGRLRSNMSWELRSWRWARKDAGSGFSRLY